MAEFKKIAESIDDIAAEIQEQDPVVALALDCVSDRLEKSAAEGGKWEKHCMEKSWPAQEKWLDYMKKELDKADAVIRKNKVGELMDEIIELAKKKYEEGDDYHGSDYIHQTMHAVKKEWDDFDSGDWKDADAAIEGIKKIEDWANEQIRRLKSPN
jgi:hypothetical protein